MNRFEGVWTALVTPFKKGEIDFSSLKKLIRQQLEGGIQGFVACGSTGEAATLSVEEKVKVLQFVMSEAAGQVPVIVGSGTFNTKESCELARVFEEAGCDGLLVVTPYYSKPPQRGMLLHFSQIADSTRLPIIVYNVPSRTSVKIDPQTVLQLSQTKKNIVGIKEATGDLEIIKDLKKIMAPDFKILSGDDGTFLQSMALGSHGVISVISHLIPSWCLKAAGKVRSSERDAPGVAEALATEMKSLCAAIYCESNPIPVKWALKEMGVIDTAEVRAPLVELDSRYEEVLRSAMKGMGVL
jgi:4-hydroxy-tetrahydrodipicolinate synthase